LEFADGRLEILKSAILMLLSTRLAIPTWTSTNFLQVFEALNYEAFEQRFAGLAAEKTVFLIEND
jgi:hypothetical protein